MLALGLGDVDHDDLGIRRERGAETEPEVERDPDHQGDVGVAEGGAARAREEELVIGGHAPAREAVQEHGDPQLLRDGQQRVLAPAPVQVAPGHDHRALGVPQERGGTLDPLRRPGQATAGAAGPRPAARRQP